MTVFLARRLGQAVAVILVASLLDFVIMQLLPGDPIRVFLGADATPDRVAAMRHQLGLDQPLVLQYMSWLSHAVTGDLGRSIAYQQSVSSLLSQALPITLHIGIVAFILSIVLGVPAGVASAVSRGRSADTVISVGATFGMAVPIFWLGIIGIYVFSMKLGWLPFQGYTPPTQDLGMSTKQIIMPAVLLALAPVASIARQTRSSMLEVIRQEYVRTARAKGLAESNVLRTHALRNALVPVLTLIGLQLRNLVGGAVLVETVFNIPGMGRLLVRSVLDKDFLVVQGCILVVAAVVVLSSLAVDVCYGYLDPRVRRT